MAYTKTTWVNGTTPVNATNMNKIEDGIYQNAEDIATLNADKAPKTSPAFAGTPTVPTATAGDSSIQIANTEFIQNALDNKYIDITMETEFETGRKIGGKKEYGKRINVGTYTSGGSFNLTKSTGLTNVTYTKLDGMLINGTDFYPINTTVIDAGINYGVACNIINNTITVAVFVDRTGFTAIIDIYYIKNS